MKTLSINFNLFALLLLPLAARAQLTFTTNNGAITITGYNTAAGLNVTIPSSTNGYPVVAIGDDAFRFLAVTNVTIPSSITSIGSYAFQFCGLTGVTIPNSVTNIGDSAFYGCNSLTNIAVDAANPIYASAGGVLADKTLATLIQCPFGLTGSYIIPNSITNVGTAFENSSLASVTIGSNLTNDLYDTFFGCNSLTNIEVNAANPNCCRPPPTLRRRFGRLLPTFRSSSACRLLSPIPPQRISRFSA